MPIKFVITDHAEQQIEKRFGKLRTDKIHKSYQRGVYYGLSGGRHIIVSQYRNKLIAFVVLLRQRESTLVLITAITELTDAEFSKIPNTRGLEAKRIRRMFQQYLNHEGGLPIPDRLTLITFDKQPEIEA